MTEAAMTQPSIETEPEHTVHSAGVQWRQVSIFVVATFTLTFLLDLVLYLTGGYGANAATSVLLQLQMLIPATVAIVLQLFFFRSSAIYHTRESPRWFFYFYLFYAAIFVLVAAGILLAPNSIFLIVVNAVIQILTIVGLIFVVVLRLASGKEKFARAGLSGAKWYYYLTFGLFFVFLYGLMTALNILFGLGQFVDIRMFVQGSGLDTLSPAVLLLIVGVQAVLIGPIVGLLIAFGEEYGWRGYLQGELVRMGRVRGLALVGVIWGVWHTPIILMGHNYPGYPILGSFLMVLYCIGLAFVLGFAVLKSGSVWLAAYLHALNNQVISFLVAAVYMPNDPVFSFGAGIYGLAMLALVVAGLLLFWRKERKQS